MRKWISPVSVGAFLLGSYLGFTRVLELIPWLISAAGDPGKLIVPEITTFTALRTKAAFLFGLLVATPCIALVIHSSPPVWRSLLLYTGSALAATLMVGSVLHGLYGYIARSSEQIGVAVYFSVSSVRWEWIPAAGIAVPICLAFLFRSKRRAADGSES